MPLTGTFERSLDDKQRMALPKPLRDQMTTSDSGSIYLAPGNDRCLTVYSITEFQSLAERMTEMSAARPEVRNFLRLFYSQAELVDLDKQGRLRIPARLLEFASLTDQVVLVGVRDHAEIWNVESWQKMVSENFQDFDALTSQAIGN